MCIRDRLTPGTLGTPRTSLARRVQTWTRGRGSLVAGLIIVSLLVVVGILAPVIAPFDPTEIHARDGLQPVSYTHLRAHETVLDLVCRLLLEKKKTKNKKLKNKKLKNPLPHSIQR